MTDTPSYPLAPQVEYIDYDEVDEQLLEDTIAAIKAGDKRREADLDLEQAHRAMIRRDAHLGSLVAAVQAGDGDGVQHNARLYASWECHIRHDVERVEGLQRELAADARRGAAEPEQEAER